jgi:hypothetical protein
MQANPKRGDSRRDFAVQRAILAQLLAGDPVARTIPELAREIGNRDDVERAVSALLACGLLEVRGGASQSLWPTRAARQCHRLEAW